MKQYAEFLPRVVKRSGMPLYLLLYVTGRCNLKCEHCFYWRNLNKGKKELSLEEMEKISKTMGPLLWLALTGGEPFLRNDLAKIVRLWVKNNQVRHISIPTNGVFTDRIVKQVKQMLKENPKTTFSITVSCDGLEKMHDKIRGMKGAFKAMKRTVRELKKLKRGYKNLGVGMVMTFTRTNQEVFGEAYEHLRDKLKPDEIFINLIRGEPRKPKTAKVDMGLYKRAVEQKMEDVKTGKLPYYGFGLMGKVAAARDGVMHDKIVKYKQGKDRYLACLAGRLSVVISEEGVVYPCELLSKKLGSIRDYDYDFKRLWEGKRAREVRQWIWKTRCACTHECFLTTNILFSPQTYTELLMQMLGVHGKR